MTTFYDFYKSKEKDSVLVCEASLTRMIEHLNKPFAIITAYKVMDEYDGRTCYRNKSDNIDANRMLRSKLNAMRMGVHQLIGHWRECTDNKIPYNQCPPDKLVDSIERSYFVPMPNDYDFEKFRSIIMDLGVKFKQNAVIISDGKTVNVIDCKSGAKTDIGEFSLGSIGQAYSQHILKQNVPFMFEGFEQIHGNFGRMAATKNGLLLPPIHERPRVLRGTLLN